MTVTPMRERLERIHDEHWRHEKPFIRNYEGVNILEDALTRLAQHPVVFIREEYARIWEHIVSLRNEAVATGRTSQDGLVVTGHPGIGKSLFLFYALGAALAAHIPVVLCRHTHLCHIFDATGVKESTVSRDDGFDSDLPYHALYLVDCNFDLRSLPSLFLGQSGVIVHVVAPRYRTAWEWAERSPRALFWIMDVWTRAEMQALQRTTEALTQPQWTTRAPPGKAIYTPLEVFDTLGPSARQCLHMAGEAKSQAGPKVDLAGHYYHTILAFSFVPRLDAILDMVRRGAPPPAFYEDEDLDCLLVLCNAGPQNPSRRPEFRYAVPTRFLHELLTDHLRRFMTRLDWLRSAATRDGVSTASYEYQGLTIRDFLCEMRTGC